MKNWVLCDGEWINFDHLTEISVTLLPTGQYVISAKLSLPPYTTETYELLDKVFDSRKEAQQYLNTWMTELGKDRYQEKGGEINCKWNY